jgi:hypothetical protein
LPGSRRPPAITDCGWISDYEPELGEQYDVEFDTDPTCVWGIHVTDAQPDEPDSIRQTEDGFEFVGRAEDVSSDDLLDGVFCLRVADSLFLFDAEGCPPTRVGVGTGAPTDAYNLAVWLPSEDGGWSTARSRRAAIADEVDQRLFSQLAFDMSNDSYTPRKLVHRIRDIVVVWDYPPQRRG